MLVAPEIQTRTEQPYVAIRARVPMDGIAAFAVRTGEVFGWLGRPRPDAHRRAAVPQVQRHRHGARTRDGERRPGHGARGRRRPRGGRAAGCYATVTHTGHPSELVEVTGALLDWGAEKGLTWDISPSEGGDRWGARLEFYLTDPREEPDMSKWQTQLAFRLAD